MRIALKLLTAMAMLAAAPVFAKGAASPEDKPAASTSCRAYQKAADGSWAELPCRELGGNTPSAKPVAKGNGDEPH